MIRLILFFSSVILSIGNIACQSFNHIYIKKVEGNYRFISPEGKPFVAIGIAHANMPPVARRTKNDGTESLFKNDEELFNKDRDQWLLNAGFNTFSYTKPAKNGNRFYWVETLNIFPGFINKGGECPDLFSDSFRNAALEGIEKIVPALANDAYLLGISISLLVLASPHQMPAYTWERRNEKPTNYLYRLQSLNNQSKGKAAYITYLQKKFMNVQHYCGKRKWPVTNNWNELVNIDLSVYEDPFRLHPDDVDFYKIMWSEVIDIITKKIRYYAPGKLVFSPRLIGFATFPDAWFDAFISATGPFVDAFIPELYASDDYTAVIKRIGELTAKPSFIGDGMRPREF